MKVKLKGAVHVYEGGFEVLWEEMFVCDLTKHPISQNDLELRLEHFDLVQILEARENYVYLVRFDLEYKYVETFASNAHKSDAEMSLASIESSEIDASDFFLDEG